MTKTLTERDLAYTLADLLHSETIAAEAYDGPESAVRTVTHYDDAGIMTSNEGLVLQLANGQEFQITIVASGPADLEDEDELAGPMTDEEIAREQEALALELRTNAYLRGELVL